MIPGIESLRSSNNNKRGGAVHLFVRPCFSEREQGFLHWPAADICGRKLRPPIIRLIMLILSKFFARRELASP